MAGIWHTGQQLVRYTLLEALRSRFVWMLALQCVLALLAAFFLSQLALTESHQTFVALAAALLRVGGVLTVVMLVATCMAREQNDRSLDLLLALPVPRAVLLLGRWMGFAICAGTVALVSTLVLLPWASKLALAAWGLGLLMECLLMSTITLFFMSGFGHLGIALLSTVGFYVLARLLGALTLIAQAQVQTLASTWNTVLEHLLRALTWLVPRLDLLTQADWLVGYPVAWTGFACAVLQAALVCALALSAALFDLYRKEF